MIEEDRKNIFVRLLTTMWLRPERALYEAYILSKLKRIIEPHLHGNTLELGCLDGTPSFAMLGGVFADDFDDYIGLDNQASPKKMGASRSSYLDDYFEHYHASDSVLAVKVATEKKFKFGISYKKSHIERAQRLDLYSHLWQQDLWAPLPFGDKTLDLIYAPLLFWLAPRSTLQSTLRELNRCMRGNGRLVATFPKANHHQYLMLHKFKYGDSAWRREIDGGIAEKLALTNLELSDLELVFRQCGFCLEAIEETVPVLVSQIYEIGFRPMFPVFLKMRNLLASYNDNSLHDVKAHWIKTILDFMLPLCEEQTICADKQTYTWRILELRPN